MQSPLRNLRKSQGLTLSHVANVVDIDPANLSRIDPHHESHNGDA